MNTTTGIELSIEQQRQQAAIRIAQQSPAHLAYILDRDYQLAAHTKLINQAILDCINTWEGRLLISVTVRSGKSTLAARYTPAWYLGNNPNKRVILAGHEHNLASEHARKARDILQEHGDTIFGVTLDPSSQAKDRWDINNHTGGLLALGVGGSPIGRGADLAIIDDPLKSWAEAQNPDARKRLQNWWQGTMSSRIEPGGSVIIVCSRWHEDDLSGWLQKNWPNDWKELRIPALHDETDPHPDPLNRSHGESYWPERWPTHLLEKRRDEEGPQVWASQWQQTPHPETNEQFPTNKINIVNETVLAKHTWRYTRAWDLAASTTTTSDYTAGVLLARNLTTKRWLIVDIVRGRWAAHHVRDTLYDTAVADRKNYGNVHTVIPQDPGQAGKDQVQQLIAHLAPYPASGELQSGSKQLRATGLSAQIQAGNVDMLDSIPTEVRAAFLHELQYFPNTTYDDQVDATASAFNYLASKTDRRAGGAVSANRLQRR